MDVAHFGTLSLSKLGTFTSQSSKTNMRKSGKSMLFFNWKNIDFYIEGLTLKINRIWFFILFFEEKNFASIFKNIYFFYACFFIFSPFFPFDLFRRNLTLDFGANKRAFKHFTPPVMVPITHSTHSDTWVRSEND